MTKEILLPEIADNVVTGYLASVLVSVGDQIEEDQSIIEVETDKAATDIPSPFAGKILDIKVNQGDEIRVGQVIMIVESADSSAAEQAGDKPKAPEFSHQVTAEAITTEQTKDKVKQVVSTNTSSIADISSSKGAIVPASPSVRRFARELGVDINHVQGTGVAGRISDDDVKAHTKSVIQGGGFQSLIQSDYAEVPDFSQWGPVDTEPMSRIRQITAESTVNSWQSIPQVVQFDKADITDIEKFRQQNKNLVEKAGGKLTMTAIILKVSAAALRKFPKFNASVDMKNRQVVYKDYVNIGVAVDTAQGLLVPIIRDADKKNLSELSLELGELAEKARSRKLSSAEMQGGNFTISNLGGISGTGFTPIVYPHQVAIMGVSKASMEQVFRDNQFVARQMMPLSLSYDHRLIDGADGARFLAWICKVLEQAFNLWL